MNEPPLIRVEGVSKRFCRSLRRSLWYGLSDLAGELAGRSGERAELRRDEFLAVENASFELRRGECLGLIGGNGAGKSTLLKMVNGLVRPDAGRIEIRGRVGALIELGAGFNPILTGRENIYVNGTILGLSRRELDSKFEEIVEFAELGDFVDAPVQSYSSGMRMRLGFAVAAHLDTDIMLIDEVLAVGDVGFRARCYNKMHELAGDRAFIFVSHNLQQIGRLCNRALLLEHGRTVLQSADVPMVTQAYLDSQDRTRSHVVEMGANVIHAFELRTSMEDGCYVADFGAPLAIRVDASLDDAVGREVECSFTFLDSALNVLAQLDSLHCAQTIVPASSRLVIQANVPKLALNPGSYRVSVTLRDAVSGTIFCWHHAALRLRVRGGFTGGALMQLIGDWQIHAPVGGVH